MKRSPTLRPPGVAGPKPRSLLLIAAGLFVLVAGTFWAAVNNGFTEYDDPDYVTNNSFVKQGMTAQSLKWAFTSAHETGNWHPITWLSHMLDYELFGPSPRGHHQTSILLHSANVALLFLLLNLMTGKQWRSLAVAALFGLHPLRVESVAWVAERKDVLSAFFGILAMMAYARYVRSSEAPASSGKPGARTPASERSTKSGGRKEAAQPASPAASRNQYPAVFRRPASVFYSLTLAFFALSLMSKPMLVTFPFVLLLLDFWPLGRFDKQKVRLLIIEKAPLFLLTSIFIVTTLVSQKSVGAMGASPPLPVRLQNTIVAYAKYLGKLFWPADLSVYYPYPGYWPATEVLLSAGLLTGVSLTVLLARRRHPCLLTGWFWYVGTLVPVIGLVQVGLQSMADRYSYLPSIGVLIAIVWGAAELVTPAATALASLKSERGPNSLGKAGVAFARPLRFFQPAAVCLTALACIVATHRQIGFWKDDGRLFQHALEVTRNNNVALIHFATYLRQQGRLAEAMEMYRQSLKIDPKLEEPLVDLGVLLYLSGEHEKGLQQLREGLKVLPNSSLLHGNLGFFLAQSGQLDEAAAHLETALKIKPDSADAHLGLGDIALKKGDREAAIQHYRQALKLRPSFAAAEKRLIAMGAR